MAAIDDGRLDGRTLGQALHCAWGLRIEKWEYQPVDQPPPAEPPYEFFVKPARWAKALGDAARTSPLHAHAVASALQQVLGDDSTKSRSPGTLLPLFELLHETLVETGQAVSAEVLDSLGSLKVSGKTGRLIKDTLALVGQSDTPAWRQAKVRALEHRIARAERWGEAQS